jgi:periplasmic divalent cation tolerance protein
MVTKQLAACANICPGMTAIYEWNGALEETGEISMILKTRLELAAALALAAAEAYPYETPAILALLDCKANDDYGRWVSEQAMGNSEQ